MNLKKSPTYFHRTFVTALLLLFFVGQTLAINDLYAQNAQQPADMLMLKDHDHGMMDHDMHSDHGMTDDDMYSSQSECCGENCQCCQGVSSEISSILNKQSKVETLASSSRLKSAHNFILNNFPNSLYRPPMTC